MLRCRSTARQQASALVSDTSDPTTLVVQAEWVQRVDFIAVFAAVELG